MTSLLSDLLSNFGDVMYSLALLNYVLSIPQTKLALATVSFSEVLPIITLLLTGYLSDKTSSKVKGILWTQIARTLIYIGVGLVMRFSPHLWIVIIVSLFNVLSDFAGQYESGLFLPLSLKMVGQEEQEQAIAFRQGVSYSCNVCYQPLSALLVGLFSYSTLAYVNAGTFFSLFNDVEHQKTTTSNTFGQLHNKPR